MSALGGALVVLLLLGPLSAKGTELRSFPALRMQKLILSGNEAELQIEPIEEETRWELSAPSETEVASQREGREWTVQLPSEPADIHLFLPQDVALVLALDRGTVQLVRRIGPVQIQLGSGTVLLEECTGAFSVQVAEGNITARLLLTGESQFRVERGNINLTLLDPVAYPLTLEAPAGRIRLALPTAYPAELSLQTEAGSVQFFLPDPEGAVQVEARQAQGSYNGGGPPLRAQAGEGITLLPLEEALQEAEPLSLYQAERGVLVDGMPEEAWLQAPEVPIGGGARFQALWDDRRLYFLLWSEEEEWESVQLAATEPDSPEVETDDGFDLVLRIAGERYRWTVNPLGVLRDLHLEGEEERAEWDSRARAVATLYPSGWMVEMAIPYRELGWSLGPEGEPALQVARVRPGAGEWSVWPGARAVAPLRPIEGPSPDSEEPLAISLLLKEAPVSEEWILRNAGIPPSRTVPRTALPTILRRLQESGWFRRVEVGESETAVQIVLAEPELVAVEAIQVTGTETVSAEQLRQRLGWRTGWVSRPMIELWQTLTEQHLQQRGYRYARVLTRLDEGGALHFEIEEGRIRRVEPIGADLVSPQAIADALLAALPHPVYREDWIAQALQEATAALSHRFDPLEALNDAGFQEGVWRVQVQERHPRRLDPLLFAYFTRVTGLGGGVGFHLHRGPETRLRLVGTFARLERITTNGRPLSPWLYRLAGEVWLDPKGQFLFSAEWAQTLESHPDEPRLSLGSVLNGYLNGVSLQNWHRESRLAFALTVRLHERFQLRFGTGTRELWALDRLPLPRLGVPWDGIRSNRPIDAGTLAYLRAQLRWDARRNRADLRRDPFRPQPIFRPEMEGVYLTAFTESVQYDVPLSAPFWGPRGGWSYLRVRADLAGGTQWNGLGIAFRLLGQWVSAPVPRPEDWRAGGPERLRSRTSATLSGDGGLYGTLELWPPLSGRFRPQLFLEAARAWYVGSRASARTEVALGGGVLVPLPRKGEIVAGVAVPIQVGGPFGSEDKGRAVRFWIAGRVPLTP